MQIVTSSPLCHPIPLPAGISPETLSFEGMTEVFREGRCLLPDGECSFWGIPFSLNGYHAATEPKMLPLNEVIPPKGETMPGFLVFLHTTDIRPPAADKDGFLSPTRGNPILGDLVGEYLLESRGGQSLRLPLRRRFEMGEIVHTWGEENFSCLLHREIMPAEPASESFFGKRPATLPWGNSQTRVQDPVTQNGNLYLTAIKNPFGDDPLASITLLPAQGAVIVLAGISFSATATSPLQRERRKQLFLEGFDCALLRERLSLDMGMIISITEASEYPDDIWESLSLHAPPSVQEKQAIIHFTAHPEARFTLPDGNALSVLELQQKKDSSSSQCACLLAPPHHPVTIRVIEAETGRTVPVKLHVHGAHGEYLPPRHRHRQPNANWFEDYAPDFVHMGATGNHLCSYIDGETSIDLPLGRVYVEIAKGFEIEPIRCSFLIEPETRELTIPLQRVLHWQEKGWITADTHVHFLSPSTALLEGEAEGIQVVNLLASQWGELFTNVGDFDGHSTLKNRTGDHMVRVGTENRQHVLGHISLLGYEGNMILPLTTGGPDESAIGDAVEATLTGWAEQARRQNGLVVLPHFPGPRGENAAVIAMGYADGVEMTSWGNRYGGLSPYSLSDWYRYLNCGYQLPAVGGTDKMSASTAIGTVRTYSYIGETPADYESWKSSVKKGHTFVTYGPLLEMTLEGVSPGGQLTLPATGGTLGMQWAVGSCTVPVSRLELVVNGNVQEEKPLNGDLLQEGQFSFPIRQSGWVALRVRGGYPEKPEVILAHSSAIFVLLDGQPLFSHGDAVTILEQIEGASCYLQNIATKADEQTYQRLLLELTAAHRALHNRMHQYGMHHHHAPDADHAAHHH